MRNDALAGPVRSLVDMILGPSSDRVMVAQEGHVIESGSQTVMLARDEEMGDGVQLAAADAAYAAEGAEVADRQV